MKKASADVGFMYIAYNLRRMMNIIDKNAFTKFLRGLDSLFLTKKTSAKRFIFKIWLSFFSQCFTKYYYTQRKIASK